jgi:hypothetical protein
MPDYRQDLEFGVFITPVAAQAAGVVELARLAVVVGLDMVSWPGRLCSIPRPRSPPGRPPCPNP